MNRTAVTLVTLIALSLLPTVAQAAENRCGWLYNPTFLNWWLEDKAGTWTIKTQDPDSEGAEGWEQVTNISQKEFVKTDGNYGYVCACMKVETDGKETVTKVISFKQLKLAQCRADKSLPKE